MFQLEILLLLVLVFVLSLILGAFFLWLALKLLGVPPEKMTFGSIIVTTLLCAIVEAFIPIIGCILAWYFIKVRHTDSWGKAIAAWILQGLIPAAIAFGIALALEMMPTLIPMP